MDHSSKSKLIFASAYPGLSSREIFLHSGNAKLAFPLNQSKVLYFYYARNSIFALAQFWKLSGKQVLLPSYMEGIELEAFLAAGITPIFYPVGDSLQFGCE